MKRLVGYEVVALLAAVFLLLPGFFVHEVLAFNEAPMLADLVKAKKLPSAEKRLPPSPAVVKPIEKPGVYGGAWRRAYTGISDLVGARRILYDPLVRWSPDYKIVPNLASKWKIDDNGKVFTFYLVKGVRWSDGKPFTADDILFYFSPVS